MLHVTNDDERSAARHGSYRDKKTISIDLKEKLLDVMFGNFPLNQFYIYTNRCNKQKKNMKN